MAVKPFNNLYKILERDGFVVINGEQITKITANRVDTEWQLIFHMSDGTTHTINNRAWSKAFVDEHFGPVPEKIKT